MLRKFLVPTLFLLLCRGADPAAAQPVPFSDTLMFVDWWVKAESALGTVEQALGQFTRFVETNEPGTLVYLIYTAKTPSQPPAGANQIRFVESYQDQAAFDLHLGQFNQQIRNRYGGLFVAAPNSPLNPFIQVENAARFRPLPGSPPAGFIRPGGPRAAAITQNVRWWLKPAADRDKVLQALARFANWCERNEPGTLVYLFSLPESGKAWPPANSGEIAFMAAYASQEAMDLHIANWNRIFLEPNIAAFVTSPDGSYPFIQVLDLELLDGFVRPQITDQGARQ